MPMRYIKGWPATRRRIYVRDGGVCHWCELPVAWGDYHLDHVLERVMGGGHEDRNLVVSHRSCNTARSNNVTRGRKSSVLPRATQSRW